jgi:hypothetical protein
MLTGGSFQDSLGNPLANGTLKFHLSQDCLVSGVGTVCSSIDVIIQLDSTGNVASSASTPSAPNQYIWSNLVMTPQNNYYRVTGYTDQGQIAFGGNNQQVGSGATFNLDNWTPNTVLSWFPSIQNLLLEVNGTPTSNQQVANFTSTDGSVTITDGSGSINFHVTPTTPISFEVNGVPASSQTLQNLAEGSNITLTDEGGGTIQIAAAGLTPIGSPGFGGFWGPGLDYYYGLTDATSSTASNLATGATVPSGTLICYQFLLPYALNIGRVTTQSLDNTGTHIVQFGIYSSSGSLVVDGRAWSVTTTGQVDGTPGVTNVLPATVTLNPGVYWHVQSTDAGGSAIPHFLGWNFPATVEGIAFWVKNSPRAATAANLAATSTSAFTVTATSQSGTTLTLTGSFADPNCAGQYIVLYDFANPNQQNNGNYLCTASSANTVSVTNPNGVAASSGGQVTIPSAGLPATLGTLTPFIPTGGGTDGICCPFYEP